MKLPVVGPSALEWSKRFRKSVVSFAQPGQLFEDLGITYVGPIPGHDLRALNSTLRRALRDMDGPVLVHVRTNKGRGYRPAEADKVGFHGAALPPMTVLEGGDGNTFGPIDAAANTGHSSLNGNHSDGDATLSATQAAAARSKPPNYTAVMAQELIAIGREDTRVVAITAGMPTGTGLSKFQAEFPGRFFDVGIAEQHAVTLATGLALGGQRPFVAIYSTFLQRAFDQIVHDVCQNDQPVVIGVDRAGLVGEDGTSHQGMFTIPAQRQLPNIIVASPKDEQELRALLRTAFAQDHPFALHYPRDPGFDLPAVEPAVIPIGTAEVLREGSDILFIGFGPIVHRASEVADVLAKDGWSVGVVNARFAKPLDRDLILEQVRRKSLVVTFEESVAIGGFGTGVLELLAEAGMSDAAVRSIPVRVIGLSGGQFIDHGSVGELRRVARLDVEGLLGQVREALDTAAVRPATTEALQKARSA